MPSAPQNPWGFAEAAAVAAASLVENIAFLLVRGSNVPNEYTHGVTDRRPLTQCRPTLNSYRDSHKSRGKVMRPLNKPYSYWLSSTMTINMNGFIFAFRLWVQYTARIRDRAVEILWREKKRTWDGPPTISWVMLLSICCAFPDIFFALRSVVAHNAK